MKRIVSLLVSILIVSCALLAVACGLEPQEQEPQGATLTGISITSEPTKKEYFAGEEFNTAGMVVTAKYSDNTSEAVTDYILSKKVLEKGDKSITVSLTKGSVTKDAAISGLIVGDSAESYFEDLLTSLVIQLKAGTEIPAFTNAFFNNVVSTLMKNLKDAGITSNDLANLARLLEEIQVNLPVAPDSPDYPYWDNYQYYNGEAWYFDNEGYNAAMRAYNAAYDAYREAYNEYIFELVDYAFRSIEKFYNTGITNTKLSAFIWEIVTTFNQIAKQVVEDAVDADVEVPEQVYAILDVYDEILTLGKEQFTKALKAFLDLAKVNVSNTALFDAFFVVYNSETAPSRNEFRDIVLALKADMVESLEVLGVNEMKAIINLFKPVVLFTVSVNYLEAISYYEYRISNAESQISDYEEVDIPYLEGQITYYQELLSEDPYNACYLSKVGYYQEVFARIEGDINEYKADIDFYEEMIIFYEGLLESDDFTDYINDYYNLIAENYGIIRASLLASLNSIDRTMAGVFYDAMMSQDMDVLAIMVGKLINTALNANGGITKENAKAAVMSGIELVLGMQDLFGEIGFPEDFEEDFDAFINKLYEDAAKFAGLSYTTILGEEFDDNIVVMLLNGRLFGSVNENIEIGTYNLVYMIQDDLKVPVDDLDMPVLKIMANNIITIEIASEISSFTFVLKNGIIIIDNAEGFEGVTFMYGNSEIIMCMEVEGSKTNLVFHKQ